MLRLLYGLIIGAVGAGIVHIAVLFLLPQFSERDAWSRLADADPYKLVRIDAEGGEGPAMSPDPLFYAAACRFDLTEGFVHIQAPGRASFWSASVYDRSGQNVYSFNDRTATDAALDFVVLTPAQMIEVRKQVPAELEGSVFVEASIDEGIVVVRAFVPDLTFKASVTEFLQEATCALQ